MLHVLQSPTPAHCRRRAIARQLRDQGIQDQAASGIGNPPRFRGNHIFPGRHHHLAVDPSRLAASVELRHPPHAHSALARDRSINFCRLRTFFRSPARDAAKIRCRNRRTSFSTCRHRTASQSRGLALGSVHHSRRRPRPRSPPPWSWRPTCPSVPASSVIGPRRLTRPASAPFRVRAPGPYPAGYPRTTGGGASTSSRFPVAFRPPAFASRVVLRPPRSSAFLTVGLPDEHCSPGPRRGCHVPHETDTTGLGALCTPGTVVRSRPARSSPAGTCRLTAAGPYLPLQHPIGGSAR